MAQPLAFLSYVREVDGMGDLTRFRQALELAVRERGFNTFEIFHDKLHIHWGDDWKQRVLQTVDDVLLIMPIISPGFFTSENCRFEIEAFLERERAMKTRRSTILPVYFVETPTFNHPGPTNDELARLFRVRSYLDFRDIRLLPKDHIDYRREIDRAATQVSSLLRQMQDTVKPPPETLPPPGPGDAARATPPDLPRPRPIRLYLAAAACVAVAFLVGIWTYRYVSHQSPLPPRSEAILDPDDAECVIAEATDSFFGPDTNAPFGPMLGAKRRVQIVGRVRNTPWVAARGPDQRLFYFSGTACMTRLQ
jgi:hypothetical protein